jgi:uncharacterized protein YbbC (DUF1343 family)
MCVISVNGQTTDIALGNENIDMIVQLTTSQKVAVVGNHTSVLSSSGTHLVDTLVSRGVNVVKVFAPEHGFRGDRANGAHINDDIDLKTGLPILSLHGKSRKPSPTTLSDIDIIIFDIQDVGARFYTYLSTLLLVMEAAAENGVSVIVLDRPNPHGHHVEGPMLDPEFKSFVGWAPVPVIHGMTLGEIAKMANGEGWLAGEIKVRLHVIECSGYAHSDRYALPIPPSPNLPTVVSIELYPSLCFLEPTIVSVGRGTPTPFEITGYPTSKGNFSFTPVATPGASPHPKHENEECYGSNHHELGKSWLYSGMSWDLSILQRYVTQYVEETGYIEGFFLNPGFFDKLAGTDKLRRALEKGESLDKLEEVWEKEIEEFKNNRETYLLYPLVRK